MTRLTYLIATTVDGFIADEAGGTDCFPAGDEHLAALAAAYPDTFPGPYRAALGIDGKPTTLFDTVVMGRATYAHALDAGLGDPYPHLDTVVASRTLPDDVDPAVTVTADPVALVAALKREGRQGIWLCGGGHLASALVDEIDELVLKTNPVAIGRGCRLFATPMDPRRFRLLDTEQIGAALVQRYTRTS